MTGPVFGSRDMWNGLGVFFDSFDNDAQVSGFVSLPLPQGAASN